MSMLAIDIMRPVPLAMAIARESLAVLRNRAAVVAITVYPQFRGSLKKHNLSSVKKSCATNHLKARLASALKPSLCWRGEASVSVKAESVLEDPLIVEK